MHFMLIGAVLHATVLGVIAFFILFTASSASGFVALLGRLLGYWILLLAVLGLVVGVGSAITGKPMMGLMGDAPWMHHGWHHMGPDHMGPDHMGQDHMGPPDQPMKPATKP